MKIHRDTKHAPALLLVVLGASLALGACRRDDRALGEPPRPEAARAMSTVSEARCDRAERCGHIGADQRFPSREACLNAMRAVEPQEVNLHQCPAGIDQTQLARCTSEIRAAGCGPEFDAIGNYASCRVADLCE